MKEKIIYGFSFVAAFLIVTLLMIYASSAYRNIFKFDFTPVDNKSEIKSENLSKASFDNKSILNLRKELLDSLNALKEKSAYDTLTMNLKDSTLIDSIQYYLSELKKLKTEKGLLSNQTQVPVTVSKVNEVSKKDSAYKIWIKNTVKLYEAMDSKKAAKIIQNYSDNIARDIIFAMKKKKAAEIIAELKPEVANRIISVQ